MRGGTVLLALCFLGSYFCFGTEGWTLPRDRALPQGRALHTRNTPLPVGALRGKRIVISPGHGYFDKPGYWTTQRGITHNLIEDIHTNEIVIDYLIPYLVRAGAMVISCRERSYQTHEVILDNNSTRGYREKGWWRSSPRGGYRQTYRYAISSRRGNHKWARFTPFIPASGYYPVYLFYRSGRNRSSKVPVRIVHGGGETLVYVDQKRDGGVWRFIGEFYFFQGRKGYVEIGTATGREGEVVVADAVRFGGGIGESKQPRWREGAKAWITYAGAAFLARFGEVNIRGRYADWRGGDGYISIHTNAGGGQGTSSFIHSYAPSPGSPAFRAKIHDQLVRDIRASVGAKWRDRGKKKANFGELRNTRTMPAVLLELAFHDHPGDARLLQSQHFRHLVARAIYKGVARYFAPKAPVSPLPPTHFSVRHSGPGKVTLRWRFQKDPLEPKVRASYYILYTSRDGFAFDNGIKVSGTSYTLSRLTPKAVYFFRVSAVNRGGESLPSETLAVRIPSGPVKSGSSVLIVNGFDRMGLRSTHNRRNFNERNYVVEHAWALAENGYFFDSTSNEALESGLVSLKRYAVVDWILGTESTRDETFSSKEQKIVKAFLRRGGSLFVSGAELAWDLGKKGSAEDRAFLERWLKVTFVADSAKTDRAQGRGILQGVKVTFQGARSYLVDYPDVLAPARGAQVCFTYPDGRGGGISYQGVYRLVVWGFPFEALPSASMRKRAMGKVMAFLEGGKVAAPR